MLKKRSLAAAGLAGFIAIGLVACNSGHSKTDDKADQVAGLSTTQRSVNDYLLGLPALKSGTPSSDPTGDPNGTPTTSVQTVGGTKYQCTSTPKTLAANPDDIVSLDADGGKMWLGALLQGQGYAGGPGSLAELPIRDRAPLTIYTDLSGQGETVTVTDPTGASVQNAITGLVSNAVKQNVAPAAEYSYQDVEASSTEQALLQAGMSVKYLGAQVTGSLDSDHSAGSSSILVAVTQRMFTVKIVTPSDPAKYFNGDYTLSDLQQQEAAGRVSEGNPPVVISQVVYGRKLIYSVTSDTSSDKLKAAVSAAYNGGSLSAKVDVSDDEQTILNHAVYKVVAVGGDDDATRNLIATHKIGDYLTAHNSLSSAVPISYQVDNVGSGHAAAFTETTDYNLQSCTAIVPDPVQVGQIVQIDNLRGRDVSQTCKSPWLFGDVSVDGANVWHTGDDKKSWTGPSTLGEFALPGLHLSDAHAFTSPYGTTQLAQNQYAVTRDPGSNTLTIGGTINDHKVFGQYPVNQYAQTLTYPITPGSYVVAGTSPGCQVDLLYDLRVVGSIYTQG